MQTENIHASIHSEQSNQKASLWFALAVTFLIPIFVWYVLYPLAGYSQRTVFFALLTTLVAGAFMILAFRLDKRGLGLGISSLFQALVWVGLAYGLIVFVGFILNGLFSAGLPLFRSGYRLDALLNGWLLTGLGEELLFSGVLFTLLAARLAGRKRWIAVLSVALLFALWHLPGYLAQGRSGMDLFGRIAINAVSWLMFGTIYALSGNLWLAAFTHGSTDYALSPMITDAPLMGLVFMLFLVLAAWISSRTRFLTSQDKLLK